MDKPLDIKEVNGWFLFLSICIISALTSYLTNNYLLTDEILTESYSNSITAAQIEYLLHIRYKYEWISYLTIPIMYALKIFVISLCLLIGSELLNYQLNFIYAFKIVLISEFIFLFVPILRFFWFDLIQPLLTLKDFLTFYPLSVMNLMENETLDPWWYYPLQILNLFELIYWLSLAYWLHTILQKGFRKMMGLVAITYGSALFIWTLLVVLFTVSISL